MSGSAQAFNYYNHTSTAQTVEAMMDAEALRSLPKYDEKVVTMVKQKAISEERVTAKAPSGISIIAVIGTLLVTALMILSILAQINHNEVAIETARLSVEVRELAETHRALSLAFESSINIREVERIARDELGMSRPDASQVITITSRPRDRAFVVYHEYEENQSGFVAFITSLFDYFR